MKTTSQRIIGTFIILAGTSASVAHAMPPIGPVETCLAVAATGDDGPSDVEQADELLRLARKAMAEHNRQLADSYISRAEALNPKYGLFHTGDTPKKCRADFNRSLGLNPDGTSTSAIAPVAGGSKDPFLGHDSAPQQPASNDVAYGGQSGYPTGAQAPSGPESQSGYPGGSSYPTTGAPSINLQQQTAPAAGAVQPAYFAAQTPQANYPTNNSPAAPAAGGAADDAHLRSDMYLKSARKALADGDARRAADQVEQARALGLSYNPMEDSPEKVGGLVNRFNSVMAEQTGHDADAYRHDYATFLMEEAKGLLAWHEYDAAEKLAGDAQNLGVQFNPVETHPDALLQQIAADRRSGGGAPSEFSPAANATAISAGPMPGALQSPSGGDDKPHAEELIHQARAAIARGDLDVAEQFARQAHECARDSAFGPHEDQPAVVLLDIQMARQRNASASGVIQAGGAQASDSSGYVTRSLYDSNNDPTHNVPASAMAQAPAVQPASDPNTLPVPTPATPDNAPQALQLFRQGEKALTDGNSDEAMRLFRLAYTMQDQLDPATKARLQDHLQMMSGGSARPAPGDAMLESAASRQRVLASQISADISRAQAMAKGMQFHEPRKALDVLQQVRARVVAAPADLDPQYRQVFLNRVDASIAEMQAYIQRNLAQIELDEHNAKVHKEVDDRRNGQLEIGEKLAALVDDYNKAIEERRFDQAEVIASRAQQIDHDNVVVHQMVTVSKMLRREAINMDIKAQKEDGFNTAMQDVDRATIPFNADFKFGQDGHAWSILSDRRKRMMAENETHRSPGDLEIEQKLTMPVSMKFKQQPLSEVLDYLRKITQVNMYIDAEALKGEGISGEEPVTIDLTRDIQLKSALALILQPLHLNYVIKNEVLTITSEDKRHGQLIQTVYPVADLVTPIPNFSPDGRQGINAALREGYDRVGFGGANGGVFGNAAMSLLASDQKGGMGNSNVQAQVLPIPSGQVHSGQPQKNGYAGPGGAGGGNQADFDSLIELITSTVSPSSWDQNGGAGSIAPFNTNLTLVVSQTQEIHEQIADLLTQLRRLQDLQVTIEVRFITLDDDYFEKIGVDFNFNIPTNSSSGGVTFGTTGGSGGSTSQVVGLTTNSSASTGFASTPNGSVQFRQNGEENANIPAFTGLTVDTTPASFGFAILSDIQAFFLVQALLGNDRSNVLQAPKVTLFNGQQAFVSDTSQEPFVTSVIPVVGDFAAAQEPIITVLSEGTSLTVQAVVSPDNRFVRLTVVPFFSQIGNVQTFQFTGSTTTSTNAASNTTATSSSSGNTTVNTGTTVQLPTFNFVTVTTTVSVPDGGTVLLGGIKRLSEGRSERGVPILSDIPYINRLFRNTAVGRTTESLMMMVTPRIIIQEEEEQKLLGTATPQ